ncbi:hypothetical protein [Phytoactinopolyspora mesophila]|nr:hypothetical protein [Phytoactinopolyspora mesophila]
MPLITCTMELRSCPRLDQARAMAFQIAVFNFVPVCSVFTPRATRLAERIPRRWEAMLARRTGLSQGAWGRGSGMAEQGNGQYSSGRQGSRQPWRSRFFISVAGMLIVFVGIMMTLLFIVD